LPQVILHRLFPIERRFVADDGATIGGYASTFGTVDSYGDRVMPGAFAASIAAHKAAGTMPAMLWQHDASEPIGVWQDIREDATGLVVRGQLNIETARGREAAALVRQGALSGLSIGFMVPDGGARYDRQTGNRILTAIDLWEISLVTFPANTAARLDGASVATRQAFEALLREVGFAKGAAAKLSRGGWPALQSSNSSTDNHKAARFLEKIEAAARALNERN